MHFWCPHLGADPVRPGLVGEDVAHVGPGDEVPGLHQGEGVWGLSRAEDCQVSGPIVEEDHSWVWVVGVEDRVGEGDLVAPDDETQEED